MSDDPASSIVTTHTYDQWCPIAVGLDVLGDRWTLLVLRELSLADRSVDELSRELRGIAPDLLRDRLRTLIDLRLVEVVGPPDADGDPEPPDRSTYRITADGRAASPVLRALARFGVRYLTGGPTEDFDAKRAASALLVPWWLPGTDPVVVRLVMLSVDGVGSAADICVGVDTCTVAAVGGRDAHHPEIDVTIRTTPAELVAVRNDGVPFAIPPSGEPGAVTAAPRAFALDR